MCIRDSDPSAHAEINALRIATEKVKNNILTDYDLFVTLEPCLMCMVAISNARIRRLYFGAYASQLNEFSSKESSRYLSSRECNHRPEIYGGILEEKNTELIRAFFQSKRGFK